ncbi:MAG: hypothetical protein RIR24_73, partial [Actinomycetota bacterium]
MSKFSDFGNDLYSGARSIDFIGRRKVFYIIAIVAILLSIALPAARGGFNFGIEFMGGSEFRVSGVEQSQQRTAIEAVQSVVPEANPAVTAVGSNDLRIQTEQLSPTESEEVRIALANAFNINSSGVASSFIGANWGADITSKAITGLLVFIGIAFVLMAVYFRTLKMSAAAMIALFHDLVLTAGIYGALGFEVTPAAVIGFLTILGYSLYDTVVVFDKIRENTVEVEFS